MFLLDGEPISSDVPFEVDGVVYPPNWIRSATPEELEAIGITEVPDAPPVDGRFWYEEGVPKPIEEVQAMYLAEIKATCKSEIYRVYPDWMQSNATARGVELTYIGDRALTPEEEAEVVGFKVMWDGIKAMRAHSDSLEAEMLALTFDELLTWQQHGWPSSETPA